MPALLPSQIINLAVWVLTLPIGKFENPTEIEGPSLLSYKNSKYFFTINNTAVVFRAPVNGVSTENSNYPRTELREMLDSDNQASWDMNHGTHTMYLRGSVTVLPKTVPKTVFAQIHGNDDDIIELRCWNRSNKLLIDAFHNGMVYGILDNNYNLGKIFTVKMVATNNMVSIFYNDMSLPVLNIPSINDACYFKAGVYPQYYSKNSTDYAETMIYSLNVSHIY
jgi:hypothetical protein